MKIYIAGPMRGIPLHNFPAFDAAATYLRARGYTVFNPADHDRDIGFSPTTPDVTKEQLEDMMRWDLARVMESDAVVFLPGWQHSRGAKAERVVAHYCGVPCYDWCEAYMSCAAFKQPRMPEPLIVWTEYPDSYGALPQLPPARSAV